MCYHNNKVGCHFGCHFGCHLIYTSKSKKNLNLKTSQLWGIIRTLIPFA